MGRCSATGCVPRITGGIRTASFHTGQRGPQRGEGVSGSRFAAGCVREGCDRTQALANQQLGRCPVKVIKSKADRRQVRRPRLLVTFFFFEKSLSRLWWYPLKASFSHFSFFDFLIFPFC